MSGFDTIFGDAAIPAIFDHLGKTGIVYTPPDGDPVTLAAVVEGDVSDREVESLDARRRTRRRQFIIDKDPASAHGGVADVSLAGTITSAGLVWAITEIDSQSASATTVTAEFVSSVEEYHQGFRKR